MLAPQATTEENPNILDPSSVHTFDYMYKKSAIFKKEAPGHGDIVEQVARSPDPCRSPISPYLELGPAKGISVRAMDKYTPIVTGNGQIYADSDRQWTNIHQNMKKSYFRRPETFPPPK